MTSAAAVADHGRTEAPAKAAPLWPAGTTVFAFKTWVALAVGYYAAFWLQLDGASSCGVCVLILAQPTQGMVLSKAIYRAGGTLAGVVAGLCITAAFPQDRVMLIASYAVWLGLTTALATVLRDFRAYGCVLAGYTVAIISVGNIDSADLAFDSAVNRVAAIFLGIAAITFANVLFAEDSATQGLFAKLRAATKDVLDLADSAMQQHRRLAPDKFVDLAARLMPLTSDISFATPELPGARARSAGGRSALLGLLESISAIQGVAVGLDRCGSPSPAVADAVDLTRSAVRRQRPERCLPAFDELMRASLVGGMPLEDAYVFDRLRFLITTMGDVRDGMLSLRTGRRPRRRVALPLHQDWVTVVLNFTRVVITIPIIAVLGALSGLPQTASILAQSSVFISLGSLQPNPSGMGNAGLFGMPVVVVLSSIYAFFVFPNINSFPLFILSLAPVVVLMCWLVMRGKPGYGLIIAVLTLVEAAPANVQTLDPETFAVSASMLIPTGLTIFMAFRLVLPVQPAQRRLRLALAMGRSLREALVDKGRLTQPRASLQYDRLAQFRTWQGGETVTPARRDTMGRMIDIGFLAYAVRRSWRALDRIRDAVPPDLDAEARRVLPTLDPAATDALARDYLDRAKADDGSAALALVHAAASLHGTALATHQQMQLLHRVDLARGRMPSGHFA